MFHGMLLSAQFFEELSAALHGVKYLDRFAGDSVIHDLKQITRKVKTKSTIFVVKSFHKLINNMGMKNVPNGGFAVTIPGG
jgi:hypothetical protein